MTAATGGGIYESEIQYFGYITEGNRPHAHYGLREQSENEEPKISIKIIIVYCIVISK